MNIVLDPNVLDTIRPLPPRSSVLRAPRVTFRVPEPEAMDEPTPQPALPRRVSDDHAVRC